MTETLILGSPSPARLVRCEAFALDTAFAEAFQRATGTSPPEPGRFHQTPSGKVLRSEPLAFLIEGDADALAQALGDLAAVSDVSDAWFGFSLEGEGWRDLISVETTFDARARSLPVRAVAATQAHQAPVMVLALGEASALILTPPSFVRHLRDAMAHAQV